MNWAPIILSLQLAMVTTLILVLVTLPLAWWLYRQRSWLKIMVESLVSLPLVLPPTVIGFYLLLAFSPGNAFGAWLQDSLGLELIFSFEGLVIASTIYSLPFMVHPIVSGLNNLPLQLREASISLGKSEWTSYLRVLLPNIKPSILTGIVLSFAHTIGEFGIVLMIGGSIPGKTRVAAIAIYDEVEALNFSQAHIYSLILLIACFVILMIVYAINGGLMKRYWQ
ncbi:MAG TPA: molybdate ABC transporter permease subunit [Saprospiraceae bacterium]|nr:molybdate ABC transporter permease subunit [Saprospiraceae bacterium]